MKKFRFRLTRVLHYRETVKDEKKRDLLLRQRELVQAELHKTAIEESMARNDLIPDSGATAAEVEIRGAFLQRLIKELEEAHVAVQAAEAAMETARAAYIEAANEFEALSLLKQKRAAEYEEYVNKETEKLLDELVVQRSPEGKGNEV